MALGVAILRLAMLLLNIYETFKVLKRPRPSMRNSGQPTIRALSQRKRSMKGCLAVWIVWCCFMLYERMAEGIVSLFVPFYDEFKSLVLLFLILTRARGAEPIFLHIIRPLLKPYTSTVDAVFDVARMFGDIVFILGTYPFHLASTWWHEMLTRFETPLEDEPARGLYADVQQALHSASYQMPPVQPPSRRKSSGLLQEADRSPMAAAQHAMPRPRVSAEHLDAPRHEIWHPPRSAYREEDDDETSDPPSLVPDSESDESRREREQMEEWRQYPPFPSAYPPTPLPAPLNLPSISTFGARKFSPIAEDPPERERDFELLLPLPLEPRTPGSVGDASDDDVFGVQRDVSTMATTEDMDDEDDDEEEEDDFDVTLRTPRVPDTIMAPMTRSRAKASSNASLDRPFLPSLLSRISSDTSSVSSASSSASPVGRKRSRDLSAPLPEPPAPRERPVAHVPLQHIEDDSSAPSSSSASSVSATDTEEEETADKNVSEPKSPVMKRRRVASPPSRVQPRRATRTEAPPPPPPPPRAQRQRAPPKAQMPDGAATRSLRLAMAAETAPLRRTADSDGPSVAPQARPSRRAAPVKRK
ncbi:hypothetical protein DFH09DRAFT_992310 [Mycena vulgaris]|nr:hypothetical protein DFH09DRAFT_992310 [Mycena vulgaris]